ncbi:MAG: GTP-binding protein [Pseudomonadota bacterium]
MRLQAERDQGVTIDASHIRLRAAGGDIVLVDAPGHREFIRNMMTGAATSDAAVLVIDALEGAQEQSYPPFASCSTSSASASSWS